MTDLNKLEPTLEEARSLAKSASDDAERAIVKANKLELDLKCLEESTVDKKAYQQLQALLVERDGELETARVELKHEASKLWNSAGRNNHLQKELQAAEVENAKLREALEWYADPGNYKEFECGPNEDFWGAGHTQGERAWAIATHADFCEEPEGVARQALAGQPDSVREAERRFMRPEHCGASTEDLDCLGCGQPIRKDGGCWAEERALAAARKEPS